MKKKSLLLSILALVLAVSMLAAACSPVNPTESSSENETVAPTEKETDAPTEDPTDAPTETEPEETFEVPTEHVDKHDIDAAECEDFRAYADEIFADFMSDYGPFDQHFFLQHPENYGLDPDDLYWMDYGADDDNEEFLATMNEVLDTLAGFRYENLDEECRMTYDLLKNYCEESIATIDLPELYEPLSFSTGIPSSLPSELAIYNFENKKDVEHYLGLLELVPEYFDGIMVFEQKKLDQGLFMNEEQCAKSIEQLESFLSSQEESFLYSTFESRIRALNLYTEDEITELLAENKRIVDECFYPSYQKMLDKLKTMKGKNKYDGAICNYPHGKEYYEAQVRSSTGSSMTPEEMMELLQDTLKKDMNQIDGIIARDSTLARKYNSFSYPDWTPEETLEFLSKAIRSEYPEIAPVNYTVNYVDESLRDFLSPAFYFVPQIDNDLMNQIFINSNPGEEAEDIFITLAHEGYPGHLYQKNYSKQHGITPLHYLLCTNGYTEGYAEYIEFRAYSMLPKCDTNLAKYFRLNSEASLCIYAICDIGINYMGWEVGKTAGFIGEYFSDPVETAKWMHNQVVSDPGGYLDYIIGELEISALASEAKKAGMTTMNFNKRLLDLAGLPFDMIRTYMFEE